MKATVRQYRPDDLGPLLKLWEQTTDPALVAEGLTVGEAVKLMSSGSGVAVVADGEDEIVGMAVGEVSTTVGWVHRVTVVPEASLERHVAPQLLEHLEAEMAGQGVRRVASLVHDGDTARADFESLGYQAPQGVSCVLKQLQPADGGEDVLAELGGRMVEQGLWDRLKGMTESKEIIERRVILPLSQPDLASRHSVASPKAIVLFGPPGTGKTTFAQAIASHLEWAFVEIQPGELAGEGQDRQAKLLADRLDAILELDSAVVFVDEVEDLASIRQQERKVRPSVTNEFLKQIPRLRRPPHHLLVCATNMVGQLDAAFLRHGRFDYILPIGPPDQEARTDTWVSYASDITDEDVDIPALVEASEMFTPADIEFAARKAANIAFEREHFGGGSQRAATEDFLAAIRATRRTLTDEMVREFNENTREFARY